MSKRKTEKFNIKYQKEKLQNISKQRNMRIMKIKQNKREKK